MTIVSLIIAFEIVGKKKTHKDHFIQIFLTIQFNSEYLKRQHDEKYQKLAPKITVNMYIKACCLETKEEIGK